MIEQTRIEQIALFPDKPHVILTAYIAGTSSELPANEKRKALLIFPGGGYYFCSDTEKDPVAHSFFARGMNVFVLTYSTEVAGDPRFPEPLLEASAAMVYIRTHAAELRIDPEEIYVMGFSAGAHLAGALGTLWHLPVLRETLGFERGSNKPAGMILSYPVISSVEFGHRDSFRRILGEKKDDAEARRAWSLEYQVDARTVPAFLWSTAADRGVPVQNTLIMAKALADAKIPFELHIYPEGEHGASIGNAIVGRVPSPLTAWVKDAFRWMNGIQTE